MHELQAGSLVCTGMRNPVSSREVIPPLEWVNNDFSLDPDRAAISKDFGVGFKTSWESLRFKVEDALVIWPDLTASAEYQVPRQLDVVRYSFALDKTGGFWNLRFGEEAAIVKNLKGMGYLQFLLKRPGERINVELLDPALLDPRRKFWAWSDAVVDYAMLNNKLWTVFGWTVRTGENPNPRFLRNFLMQANGSEMLRLACCLLTENGIRVCAPVHDAVLIEAPISSIREVCLQAQALLEEASSAVLDGFRLRSDVDLICFPDRYMDERGARMWSRITEVLDQLEPSCEEGCIDV